MILSNCMNSKFSNILIFNTVFQKLKKNTFLQNNKSAFSIDFSKITQNEKRVRYAK
jgi:hypothetical protein